MSALKKSSDFQNDARNNNNYMSVPLDENGNVQLETKEEKRQRQLSLWIVYATVFIQCLGASIVITPLWPYLQKLDNEASKEWFGAIVAANPLGQLIFSPIIGWWCNRLKSIRVPSLFCLGLFMFANIWYALLPLHCSNVKYFMFTARFLVGVSSGSVAACRTYLSQGTLVAERTGSISTFSLCQSLGFILGPIAQVALTFLGDEGYQIHGKLSLSMYTASSWIAAIAGLLNVVLYLPKLFQESNIAEREILAKVNSTNNKENGKDSKAKKEEIDWSRIPPDYIGIFPIVSGFFFIFFGYSLLETLATPVMIDQFGMDNAQAIKTIGVSTAISSVVALACFFTIPALCRRFDERKILIGLGLFPTLLGRVLFFPLGGPIAPMRIEGCVLNDSPLSDVNSKTACNDFPGAVWTVLQHGCPKEQSWCFEIAALNGIALGVGYAICTIGYPYSVVLLQTIFSKMIGPRPQGVWMGFLTGVSSLARVVGPFFVTFIYTKYGTIATSAAVSGLMMFSFICILGVYKRLVPIKIPNF